MSIMDEDLASEDSSSVEEQSERDDKSSVMEKCLLGNKIISIPQDMCEQEEIFKDVINIETWQNVLTNAQKSKLMKFLPTFPENDDDEKLKTLKQLFSGHNFKFGNPLFQFYKKLKDGYLAPDVSKVASLLKKAQYREYKYQQQHYYYRLLENVLISRKKLLDAASMLSPDNNIKIENFAPKLRNKSIQERTKWRYFSQLQEVREECGELDTSSEDENYPGSPPKLTRKLKKQVQSLEASLSPDMHRVVSTVTPAPGFHDGGPNKPLNHSLAMFEMTEDRYREMLLRHKQRREGKEDHPELDTSNISFEDIIARTNCIKRFIGKSDLFPKKKLKGQDGVEKKPKIIGSSSTDMQLSPSHSQLQSITDENVLGGSHNVGITTLISGDAALDDVDVDVGSDGEGLQSAPPRSATPTYPSCFFSLVRNLFYETPEQKMSASKLEDKVRIWMESPIASSPDWVNVHDNWADLVGSVLKFLAGDLIGILPENFVPYLDYKEKQQQWQWIGAGRDSGEQLNSLCQHWLENKDDLSLDVLESSQGSPPPPRVVTDWTVRPTSEEERQLYREQERVRYQNPHKAFTFRVHGYESVVGPVKGVYGKESGVNKAREHSLLVSDRPPFVTILSLVRDAAARLPNGEGTRSDICELLKDSQYLSAASDQQIHTVVSGALDRLHYEKDPCVKYDVNRKLWIYLHRSRTEEEFERIHQAQAAAAKAKKAIQKNKTPRVQKTNKDTARSLTITEAVNSLTVDVPSSNNITISASSQSPRGSGSPRTQNSPKQTHGATSRQLMRSLSLPTQTLQKVSALPSTSEMSAVLSSPRRQDISSVLTAPAIPSPKLSAIPILSQPPNGGNNSRPPSQCSLPSPKTVIANVNAAQFVGVTQLQSGGGEQSIPSPSNSPTPPPGSIGIDMKPSSPAFVGQPPVLQPVLSQAGGVINPSLTTTMSPALAKAVSNIASKRTSCSSSSQVQGFQTIVIKQDPSGKPGTSIATLPILATASAAKSSAMGSKPVMARVVAGTQVVSLSNLVARTTAQAVAKQGSQSSGTATFRIQSGNFVQPVGATGTLGVLQASQLAAAAKLPRLAVVTQSTSNTVTATPTITAQPKLITLTQGQLGMLQAAQLDAAASHEAVISAASKTNVVSNQTGIKTVAPSVSICGKSSQNVVTTKSSPPVTTVTMPTSSGLPSVILASGNPTSSPTVVIATQGTLKPSNQTYVMAAPGTSPTVVMAAATQQGVRGVTPLNVKALPGIKVIPMSQAMSTTKGTRTQPLLARIITPPAGITIRPGSTMATVTAGLGQTQQVGTPTAVSIVQGLGTMSHAVPATKPSASLASAGSQPVIVQVQNSTQSENVDTISHQEGHS